MKKFRLLLVFTLIIAAFSCSGSKHGTKDPYASDRHLTITFHPFWGGAAICDLERKNGKDALFFEYEQTFTGLDSISKQYVQLSTSEADSLFYYTEKINWTQPLKDGSAVDKVGLKVSIAYKRKTLQTMSWEKLKSVDELPADVLVLLHKLNDIAPDEYKMF
ncbi:MAG TPA: hypothetical protein VL651_02695 [Bacteroidia bacterium]|jgi:hypothetical protein|nr:hypothetical protein [Bacteroidia bacterium]